MKRTDFSLHFQTKTQTPKEVFGQFDNWYAKEGKNLLGDKTEGDEFNSTLHHCFLSMEKFERDVKPNVLREKVDIIQETLEYLESEGEQVNWSQVDPNLGMCRLFMLKNIKKLNGISIFIGDIIDGVKEEYDLAVQIGIECILLDHSRRQV